MTAPIFRIYVREEKRRSPVKKKTLEKLAARAFDRTGKRGDVSLVFCDDTFIQDLNERYLKRPGPTDVLSFSLLEGEDGEFRKGLLGDIVISVDTATRQAEQMKHSLEKEVMILFIHGLLHLLGYTHDSETDEKEMTELTNTILMEVDRDL